MNKCSGRMADVNSGITGLCFQSFSLIVNYCSCYLPQSASFVICCITLSKMNITSKSAKPIST